jgi:integrase
LPEACGLLVEDIKLDIKILYLDIKPYTWWGLKTKGSARQLPLVGSSLWAAQWIVINAPEEFAFPRYCNDKAVKANSTSGSLNKWLRKRCQKGVIHSFRHSFRDRLLEVQCPSEMIDTLGGWSTASVGSRYGSGYNERLKYKWMLEITG